MRPGLSASRASEGWSSSAGPRFHTCESLCCPHSPEQRHKHRSLIMNTRMSWRPEASTGYRPVGPSFPWLDLTWQGHRPEEPHLSRPHLAGLSSGGTSTGRTPAGRTSPGWTGGACSPAPSSPASGPPSWPGWPPACGAPPPAPPVPAAAAEPSPSPDPATSSAPRSSRGGWGRQGGNSALAPGQTGLHPGWEGRTRPWQPCGPRALPGTWPGAGCTCCCSRLTTEPLLPLRRFLWNAAISSVLIFRIFCCCSCLRSSSCGHGR